MNMKPERDSADAVKATPLADYIIQALRDEGASHVFLVPGGYVDNFSQSLVSVAGITPVVCASESGAAFMADGFARAAGRFAVCMGISGPGASNMLTALSLSAIEQVPVLVITGDAPLAWRNRDVIQDPGSQGLKTTQLLATVCQQQIEVVNAQLINDYLRRLMPVLKGPKTGVAHMAVPLDLQQARLTSQYRAATPGDSMTPRNEDRQALSLAFSTLAEHNRIVILAGSGIRRSGATEQLRLFAEKFALPVATTMDAKGDFPETHPLSMGVFGWAGTAQANETLLEESVDLLLVIGARLGQVETFCWHPNLAQSRTLIQVDSRAEYLNRTYVADLAVLSDEQRSLAFWLTSEDKRAQAALEASIALRKQWWQCVQQRKTRFYDPDNTRSDALAIHPARAIWELQKVMPENSALFVDNGAHTFFATHYWTMQQAGNYFNVINYSGAMGWAIPASIGAKLARPEQCVLAIVGDGCMLMQGMEIQTAARYRLQGIIFVVINNRAHGNPKLRAAGFTAEAEKLTDIVDHDWAAFARSLGVRGLTVSKPADLARSFALAAEADGPVLIDIKCGLYPTPTYVFDQTFMQEFNRFITKESKTYDYAE